ncbi:MAG TPA: hypothetical protein VMB21_09920 [Candidatus Limnocylindria bacterium]|jgi:hypothetical protein|nr:hypothetical protein [Candidatus Limnocylindria bacterium]
MKVIADLRLILDQHLALCREILALVELESLSLRENDSSQQFEFYQAKKNLLGRLDESVRLIKDRRREWQNLPVEERTHPAEVEPLLRQNQDLIMKIIVLDRENEQNLLRRGLVPPRHLPSPNRQRPHFVADLYRRQCQS